MWVEGRKKGEREGKKRDDTHVGIGAQMIKLNLLSRAPDFELSNESGIIEHETVRRLLILNFISSMSTFSSLIHLLLFYLPVSSQIF